VLEVNRILDETKHKFDDLHAQEKPVRDRIQQEQVDAVHAILSEEQRPVYDTWRRERARLHAEQAKKQAEQAKKLAKK
jgi:hypothetical protein